MKRGFSTIVSAGLVWAALLLGTAFTVHNSAQEEESKVSVDDKDAGEHLRLETERGPIHLWRPADYDPRTAGTVVYVHGYFTSVDQTWTDDHLAEQFAASGRNALFIAPQAPQSMEDPVSWKSLEALLRTVDRDSPFRLPQGPLVVIGHSGAFRTILHWLDDPRVRCVILLDGLYHGQREFRYWLHNSPGARSHRLVLVGDETSQESDRFARHIPGAARRSSIPEELPDFAPAEIRAPLLYLHSQYEHLDIVSGGKVIPLLLQLTVLKPVAGAQETPLSSAKSSGASLSPAAGGP
jgi:hypothetical protein